MSLFFCFCYFCHAPPMRQRPPARLPCFPSLGPFLPSQCPREALAGAVRRCGAVGSRGQSRREQSRAEQSRGRGRKEPGNTGTEETGTGRQAGRPLVRAAGTPDHPKPRAVPCPTASSAHPLIAIGSLLHAQTHASPR
jgi:hypothetical protein